MATTTSVPHALQKEFNAKMPHTSYLTLVQSASISPLALASNAYWRSHSLALVPLRRFESYVRAGSRDLRSLVLILLPSLTAGLQRKRTNLEVDT